MANSEEAVVGVARNASHAVLRGRGSTTGPTAAIDQAAGGLVTSN